MIEIVRKSAKRPKTVIRMATVDELAAYEKRMENAGFIRSDSKRITAVPVDKNIIDGNRSIIFKSTGESKGLSAEKLFLVRAN